MKSGMENKIDNFAGSAEITWRGQGLFRLKYDDPSWEDQFHGHYAETVRRPVQIGLTAGVIIYALFFLVDIQKVSNHAMAAFFIRFAFMIPMAIGVIAFSYKDRFRGILAQVMLSTLLIAAGASVLTIDYLSDNAPQVVYYIGIVLIIFCVPISRLLFGFAIFTSMVLAAEFCAYLLIVQGAGGWEMADKMLLTFSAVFLSLIISYFSELHIRKEFVLARSLDEARMQATQATGLKDKLMSLVTHDLKDPLSSIKALVEIMKNFGDDLSHQRKTEILKGMDHNVRKMNETINMLLRLRKLRGGELIPEQGWFQLSGIADQALRTLQAVADGKNVTLKNDVRPEDEIFADRVLIDHVLQNLISNAVRHTPAGGLVRIYRPAENGATFAVEDNGEGMPRDLVDLISSGNQITSDRRHNGDSNWGMGLQLVTEIVAVHGGSVGVKSELGHGSVFYVFLPQEASE